MITMNWWTLEIFCNSHVSMREVEFEPKIMYVCVCACALVLASYTDVRLMCWLFAVILREDGIHCPKRYEQ
jgi:hypothetical protein